jgi:hypothetical protein
VLCVSIFSVADAGCVNILIRGSCYQAYLLSGSEALNKINKCIYESMLFNCIEIYNVHISYYTMNVCEKDSL